MIMRSALIIFALFLAAPVTAAPVAFVNVNVLPMSDDSIVEAQTVLVENGRIMAIGPVDEVPIPKHATVVDGTDRFLMPGLAEMHAHVPDADAPELDRDFSLFVANGVTTVRGMLGRPSHLPLRQQLLDGTVFGPRLITSGPSLNGRSVTGPEHAARLVAEQHAAGYDFIKIHPGLEADEFAAIAKAAAGLGMPFAGHVPVAVGVYRVLELDMATIDHLDGYFAAMLRPDSQGAGGFGGVFDVMLAGEVEAAQIPVIARATAEAGTWNVVTETLVEQLVNDTPVSDLRNRPEMRYMPKATVRDWVQAKKAQQAEHGFDPQLAARAIALRRSLIMELDKAGAGFLLGSDAPQIFNVPGFSLHRELELLVAAGLSPFAALRAGTVAPAEFLGLNTGMVAVGRDADLVLLDANPLSDVANTRRIHGVMLRGQWYPAGTLQARIDRFLSAD
jgi:hypothetical protein